MFKTWQSGECAITERNPSDFRTVRNDELRTTNYELEPTTLTTILSNAPATLHNPPAADTGRKADSTAFANTGSQAAAAQSRHRCRSKSHANTTSTYR